MPSLGYSYVNLSDIVSVYPFLDVRHLQGTNDTCMANLTAFFGSDPAPGCGCSDDAVPDSCASAAQAP